MGIQNGLHVPTTSQVLKQHLQWEISTMKSEKKSFTTTKKALEKTHAVKKFWELSHH